MDVFIKCLVNVQPQQLLKREYPNISLKAWNQSVKSEEASHMGDKTSLRT